MLQWRENNNAADRGAYFRMVTDKYDINWMVSYDKNRRR